MTEKMKHVNKEISKWDCTKKKFVWQICLFLDKLKVKIFGRLLSSFLLFGSRQVDFGQFRRDRTCHGIEIRTVVQEFPSSVVRILDSIPLHKPLVCTRIF
jgi:hypothetical protein